MDTEHKHEREILKESQVLEDKKRISVFLDSIRAGILTLSREFTILSANKCAEEWLNKSAHELIGNSAVEMFHGGSICPHCVAEITFETGNVNSATHSKGQTYAELTSYPVKDGEGNVIETIVFIQDVTENVKYLEAITRLSEEVTETKEYLEGIIDYSADAIVTSDLNRIITSWNMGAEKIYGFTKEEAIGKSLPFIPEYYMEAEKRNFEKAKSGEVLKDIESIRRKKDGTSIEVSLTFSPIRDAEGKIVGVTCISRDVTEKKRVEKELIRRSQELSRLLLISSAMRGTLGLDRLLRIVLTAVTMSEGLGFNRAILFLVDEKRNVLKGVMGVGPASHEEAWQIWGRLSLEKKTLSDIIHEIERGPLRQYSFLDRLSLGIEIPLLEETILTRAVKEKIPFNIQNVQNEPLSDRVLVQQLGTQAYAVAPLISRDKVVGVIWVDNHFNRMPILEEDMRFLSSFVNHAATAIESARLFEKVALAEQELENIFESISDGMFFMNGDYVIRKINKAVSRTLGKPPEEIIGKKCYEVLHGMNEPRLDCPHHKTVETHEAFVEELEEPYLGGTFITSSSPILNSAGEFIGTVHVVRDITDIKKLQEQLVLAERMSALGEVAARVAHDIRNPLVSIGGFARRLEKNLQGNLKEYAEIITKEISRLEIILGEILSFVRGVTIEKRMVDINTLIDEVITVVKSEIEERQITVTKELSAPEEAYVDPGSLKEALLNIFTNACHAIESKGTISIKTSANKHHVVIEIKDTGSGIPEEHLPFIFDPFFTTKGSGSTGLGLTITHKIIEKHNGRIEVESKPQVGSTFRIFLPLKK